MVHILWGGDLSIVMLVQLKQMKPEVQQIKEVLNLGLIPLTAASPRRL